MADKQAALTEAIAKAVAEKLAPEFRTLAEQVGKVTVLQNTTIARLDTLEGAGAKAGGTTKPATRKVVTATAAAAGDEDEATLDKIKNALLWFRYVCGKNGEERARLLPDALIAKLGPDNAALAKKNKATNPVDYYKTAASEVWKTFTDAEMNAIREEFKAWAAARTRTAAEPPLEPEDV
jgi:hypothetical protein